MGVGAVTEQARRPESARVQRTEVMVPPSPGGLNRSFVGAERRPPPRSLSKRGASDETRRASVEGFLFPGSQIP